MGWSCGCCIALPARLAVLRADTSPVLLPPCMLPWDTTFVVMTTQNVASEMLARASNH